MERQTISGFSGGFIVFGYAFLALLVNLCYIIFLAVSFDTSVPMSENRNIIAIAATIWYYFGLMALVIVFGLRMLIWEKLKQEKCGIFMFVLIVIFYPIYFLLTLPMTVYYVFKYLGTPCNLWEKVFQNSCISLDHLTYEVAGTYCKLVLYYMSIGLLFALFTLFYVIFVFAFFPIYYYLFAPFGFGPYGINIFLSLRHLDEFSEYSWDCIEKTYLHAIFVFAWFVAFPAILFAVFYMVFVLVTAWHAILLLVAAALYFFIFGIITSIVICCGSMVQQLL
ncbi:hypothetical protein M9Y10_045750 [Tritrichomonas musculus]|uniref:Transmembrane protein n=1 Tax=Tritrichomonas musculus TaxID=1915356 RepID=A0ABR2JW45_9EUKA